MIVSRLRKIDGNDGPFLTGQTYYDVKAKTILILRKSADGRYELRELGERRIDTSPESLLSFTGGDYNKQDASGREPRDASN